jgi:hypothetical protein
VKDRLGILFSGLCVVHCILFSFFLWGGVGSIGFIAASEELIHPILLLLVFFVGLISFPSAYIKHKQKGPLLLGIIGTTGLFLGLFTPILFEILLTTLSGTVMITAHLWNYRLNH